MTAYLEFHIKGAGCAVVEAGSICAVIGKGHDLFTPGTPETPTLVIFRGSGETLEVIGESVGGIITRMISARQIDKESVGSIAYFDRIDQMPQGDEDAIPSKPVRP